MSAGLSLIRKKGGCAYLESVLLNIGIRYITVLTYPLSAERRLL